MSINTIKELRELTGLSFTEIRRALQESGNDKQKALQILRDRGASIADKKASRSTNEGVVESYVHGNKKIGVLLEILCETDFVARNPLFGELAHECAMHIAAMDPQNIQELLEQPFIKDQNKTLEQLVTEYIAKLGENIRISRFNRFQI